MRVVTARPFPSSISRRPISSFSGVSVHGLPTCFPARRAAVHPGSCPFPQPVPFTYAVRRKVSRNGNFGPLAQSR